MHWVGLVGMPRRVADYAATFGALNMVVSIASFALGASVVVFFYNMITSWARGPIAGSNPWRAMTIEWQVTSPPPVFNFDEIPQVVGGPYEYGVPGARHAVLTGRRAAGGARSERREPTTTTVVLVVANETLGGRRAPGRRPRAAPSRGRSARSWSRP